MRLYYGKTTAVALATFLMAGTDSVHAGRNFSDVRFQFAEEEDNNLKPDLTGLKTILRNPDSITIKNYTDTLDRKWVDKQNKTYIRQGTFMDILMENINFNALSLDASNLMDALMENINFNALSLDASSLRERSQFRAILKGMCKSVNIEESNTIWQSIGTLDDKTASLWFKAVIAARSKDQTFFNSYFNLTNLDLSYTNITDVDVTQNTALRNLKLNNTNITVVDVTQNTALTNLDLSYTNIADMDVTQNPELIYLDLTGTNIPDVDVSKNPALIRLLLPDADIA